jgi:glycosyltransferase involved in cell wall biosynthesis
VTADVDILLPVRDAAATLPEALASIRAQTFRDFRCLVLDDGSADESAKVAEAVAAVDARFDVRRLPRRGLVATLNDGLAQASAVLVARLDADDLMMPERLALQRAFLRERAHVDVAASRVEFFGERVPADLVAYERWLNEVVTEDEIERDLFVECPLPHPSVVMRLAAVRGVAGYRDVDHPEDYDLFLRLWRAGSRFGKHPDVLTRVRDHPGRLTRTSPRYSSRALLECKAEHLVEAKGLSGREIVVWGAGRDGIRAAKALRRRGAMIRHLVDIAATKIGKRMLGVAVRGPESLAEEPRAFVVCAVGVKGARALIRARLAELGYRELDEFVCFG